MRVYLDEKAVGGEHGELARALRAGVEEARRAGRVVVEVYLDGERVDGAVLLDAGVAGDVRVGEVRLVSVEPRGLVRATLQDAAAALESAAACQRSCAGLIQAGKVEEALGPLSSALQTWQAVREAVEKGTALAQLPLDEMTFPGGASGADRMVDLIGSLASRLEEVKRSLGAQDWSGLADVMEYDMAEQAARWREVLGMLAAALERE